MDFSQAMSVLSAFARHRVEYVLVGSMAMAAQGLVRATRDMDVFVAPDVANVERLRAALRELFEDPSIEEIRSEDLTGDYRAHPRRHATHALPDEAALRPRGGVVPLRKFRSAYEMPSAAWREPLDPANLRLACDLSALATRLRPRRFSPGLHKYRSAEDAADWRARWESAPVSGTGGDSR